MDRAEAKEALRWALSRWEKAGRAAAAHAQELASGDIDRDRYHLLRADCDVHRAEADAEILRLRESIRAESVRLAQQLRAALDDQARLSDSVNAGRTTPETAKEMGQQLAARVDASRAGLAELNALHAAQSSEDLGGFIDRPLDGYAYTKQEADVAVKQAGTSATRRFPWSMAACAVAVVVLATALHHFYWVRPIEGECLFEAAWHKAPETGIGMTWTNGHRRPITVHVPWPEGGPDVVEAEDGNEHYGVSLYVREDPQGPWRLLAAPPNCWEHLGHTLAGQNSFVVEPGFTLDITMKLGKLGGLGIAPKAIKAECSRSNGRINGSYEMELPPK